MMYLFTARQSNTSDISKLTEISLHLILVETVRDTAHIENSTMRCLEECY